MSDNDVPPAIAIKACHQLRQVHVKFSVYSADHVPLEQEY
jgi:hypothetical protein